MNDHNSLSQANRSRSMPGSKTVGTVPMAALSQIATLADAVDREIGLSRFGQPREALPEGPELDAVLMVGRLQDALCQIGAMADLASERAGGKIARRDTAAWLLSCGGAK